jgi:predicted O-linked N-acetylglucosamine transferase (SPINDLY family)
MPDLSVANLSEYEEFAVRIAHSPKEASALRKRLCMKVAEGDAFDADFKTRSLEKLYEEVHIRV